ncbi:MAG: acyl carrier protein [Pseudomonadota bacterium]
MQADTVTIIAAALNLAPEAVTPATSLATTTEWDSLAHFRLVLAIEEQMGRQLDPLEIATLLDFDAVAALLGQS